MTDNGDTHAIWRLPHIDEVDTVDPALRTRIDTSLPHPARMYDYYLGGRDNFAADREAAEQVIAAAPSARPSARGNRAFLQRAVRHLAENGVRQFLDIGTGIPTAGNTHEVAQAVAPDSAVVYADNDPIVLTHARALAPRGNRGRTAYIQADVRDPAAILASAELGEVIDLSQPVAVLLVAVLHFVRDSEDPAGIVATIRDALPPGSHLILSHTSGDFDERARGGAQIYDRATAPVVMRSRAEIEAMFDGFTLLEPGLVPLPQWRPGIPETVETGPYDPALVWLYGGVGRL